ncbi:MAG: hypothetical protein E7057_10360 [Lentisphaerae bacterium]|nr:hypothetical protein [Lentisphaerota bacterium]
MTVAGHWVLPLSYCACAPGASAFGTLSGRSAATASHPCVEHATEGINQYREQSQTKNAG